MLLPRDRLDSHPLQLLILSVRWIMIKNKHSQMILLLLLFSFSCMRSLLFARTWKWQKILFWSTSSPKASFKLFPTWGASCPETPFLICWSAVVLAPHTMCKYFIHYLLCACCVTYFFSAKPKTRLTLLYRFHLLLLLSGTVYWRSLADIPTNLLTLWAHSLTLKWLERDPADLFTLHKWRYQHTHTHTHTLPFRIPSAVLCSSLAFTLFSFCSLYCVVLEFSLSATGGIWSAKAL